MPTWKRNKRLHSSQKNYTHKLAFLENDVTHDAESQKTLKSDRSKILKLQNFQKSSKINRKFPKINLKFPTVFLNNFWKFCEDNDYQVFRILFGLMVVGILKRSNT